MKTNRDVKVKELIEILQKMPQDAEVFVAQRCIGTIIPEQVQYDEKFNQVKFSFMSDVDKSKF